MQYISTRGNAPELSFRATMLTGLALDGGLYVPKSVPKMSRADIKALQDHSYEETAFRVMRPFVGDTFTDETFYEIIEASYKNFSHAARAPLVQLDSNHFLLELFHGPTLAFKDFAMQLIGQMFQAELRRHGGRVTIVGATSGDTGSAAIEAFRGLDTVDVFIIYPHGRVSEVQRRQMTTPEDLNVHTFALNGNFDDCQAQLKNLFNDFEFRDSVRLSAVNSINWARVLAQVVYYFFSAVSLGAPDRKISFTVPTGNFGDVFAGYIAKQMGLPIDKLIVATNQNNILHRCLDSGEYRKNKVLQSYSPSMDIQVSSNFERALFDAHDRDGKAVCEVMAELKEKGVFTLPEVILADLKQHFSSGSVSEQQTLEIIQVVKQTTGELLCPHSAIGVHIAQEQRDKKVPMITLATAHPAKFPNAIEKAIGLHPKLPERMNSLYDKPERVTKVGNNLEVIKNLILDRISS